MEYIFLKKEPLKIKGSGESISLKMIGDKDGRGYVVSIDDEDWLCTDTYKYALIVYDVLMRADIGMYMKLYDAIINNLPE